MADGSNYNYVAELEGIEDYGEDMTQASSGGGNWIPPEAGHGYARFVQYIELGNQPDSYDGKPKTVEKVRLAFELIGKKWPVNEETGLRPLVGFNMAKSLSAKSHFFKMFSRMNYDGSAKHMAQLLGKPFKVEVTHNVKGEGDKKRTYVNLRNADGYTVAPAFKEITDEETMEVTMVPVTVPEPTHPVKVFLWNKPSKGQWDNIFIDGERDDGTSKNWMQDMIRSAKNFAGSPIQQLLGVGGKEPDVGEAEKPKRTEANKEKAKAAGAANKGGAAADPLEEDM